MASGCRSPFYLVINMSKTIAALATGNSPGGIGVIRISGDSAIEIADRVFECADGSSLLDLKGYRAKFGCIKSDGERFDNAVALVFRAPKSYTGEDVAEISVHGGIYIIEKALGAVFAAGAEPAEAGEFTKRAFLNGKLDLTQAESVADLISAEGEAAAQASFNLLQGALSRKITAVQEMLVDSSALMAAWVDYPDEEIPELEESELCATLKSAQARLEELLAGYDSGQTMTHGVETVIAGKPNAGKSTLMNLLAGREKSIVTEIAGTTRDVVEESVRLGGLVLHLNDTAGIHAGGDTVESIGIKRAKDKIEAAALVLAVFDSSAPLTDEDFEVLEACEGKRAIAVINKTDLETRLDCGEIEKRFAETVYISAKNGYGALALEAAVKRILGVEQFDTSAPILANQRQKDCCRKALDYIKEARKALENGLTYDAVNVMMDSAVDELLALTGQKATVEVVNNIFSKFCVGK